MPSAERATGVELMVLRLPLLAPQQAQRGFRYATAQRCSLHVRQVGHAT